MTVRSEDAGRLGQLPATDKACGDWQAIPSAEAFGEAAGVNGRLVGAAGHARLPLQPEPGSARCGGVLAARRIHDVSIT